MLIIDVNGWPSPGAGDVNGWPSPGTVSNGDLTAKSGNVKAAWNDIEGKLKLRLDELTRWEKLMEKK